MTDLTRPVHPATVMYLSFQQGSMPAHLSNVNPLYMPNQEREADKIIESGQFMLFD
jgi:hypothetical protein